MRNDANTESQPSAINFSIGPSVALIVLEPQVNTFRLVLTPFRCGSQSPWTASVWGAKMEDTQMEKAILMVKICENDDELWDTMGIHGIFIDFSCFFGYPTDTASCRAPGHPCHRSTTSPPKRAWPRRWLWRRRRDCWDETIVGSKTAWWFERVWNRLKYTIIYYNSTKYYIIQYTAYFLES